VVALLLKLKANINVTDNNGETPLSIAVKNNSKEMINLFMSRSRDLNANTRHTKSPKSVDFFRKYSSSKKRSQKQNLNFERSTKRLSIEQLSSTKNFLKYKQYSNFLGKTLDNSAYNTIQYPPKSASLTGRNEFNNISNFTTESNKKLKPSSSIKYKLASLYKSKPSANNY